MTEDEIIAVVTAYKEGKTIQRRPYAGHEEQLNNWIGGKPDWNFAENEYRIKPEPREWYIKVNEHNAVIDSAFGKYEGYIHVREVMDN